MRVNPSDPDLLHAMNPAKHRSHEINIRIPFHDLDPMQIVWHGNYLKYFDMARSALFDSLGVDLYHIYENDGYLFPIIRTNTKYIAALRHRDEIVCTATLLEARMNIKLAFEIRRLKDGVITTQGQSEQVAVRCPQMELMFKIPDEIRTALGF